MFCNQVVTQAVSAIEQHDLSSGECAFRTLPDSIQCYPMLRQMEMVSPNQYGIFNKSFAQQNFVNSVFVCWLTEAKMYMTGTHVSRWWIALNLK